MTVIDGLRGIAALVVILPHSVGIVYTGSQRPGDWVARSHEVLTFGGAGVDIFFVISGFVIAYATGRATVGPRYVGRFALRRSLRLDPPYWASIALALGVLALRQRFGSGTGAELAEWPTLGSLVAHLFYLPYILGYEPINDVYWTLCLEVQFYLIQVLLLMIAHASARRLGHGQQAAGAAITLAAFVVSLYWATAYQPGEVRFLNAWFVQEWYKFLLGAVLYQVWAGALPRWIGPASVGGLALLVALQPLGPYPPRAITLVGNITAMMTGALLLLAMRRGAMFRWLSWKPLIFAGTISYSLYLIHIPLIELFMAVQNRLRGNVSPAEAFSSLGLFYVIAMFCAWVGYRLVELPAIRLAKRVRPSGGRIPTPAGLAGGIEGPAPEKAAGA